MATCILDVTSVTFALVLPQFIFICKINIAILVILHHFAASEYHVQSWPDKYKFLVLFVTSCEFM